MFVAKKTAFAVLFAVITAATPASAAYVLDDGTPEAGIGYFSTVGQLWLNAFQVQAGEEQIHTISIMFGANPPENGLPANGTPFELVLFTDPNTGDGNPIDAVLQRQQSEVVASSNTVTFVDYLLDTPITLDVGDWFFVGMYRATPPGQNVFGPNVDTDGTQAGRSHRFGWFTGTPDVSNIAGSGASASPDTGRNFMIRASGSAPSTVPEPSSMLLLSSAVALFAFVKRRR